MKPFTIPVAAEYIVSKNKVLERENSLSPLIRKRKWTNWVNFSLNLQFKPPKGILTISEYS